MLTRLREIVEKVASAPRLNEALNILVTDICLAMDTEVCSVYLADHDRRCYYLMATRGLKKPRGRTVALAFDEGIVGLVGRLAEPINLADAQKHPSFKYIPSVKEERFRAFLGVPIIQRRQLLGVLVVQQRELRQYDESEESSSSRSLRRWRLSCHSRRSQRCSGNTGRRESARFLRRRAWLSQRAGKTRPCR